MGEKEGGEEERRESKGEKKRSCFRLRTNRKGPSWSLPSAENSLSTILHKTLLAHQSSIAPHCLMEQTMQPGINSPAQTRTNGIFLPHFLPLHTPKPKPFPGTLLKLMAP